MSKKKKEKLNIFKVILTILFMAIIIFFVTSGTEMLKNPIDVFILEKGAISYEEASERIYNTR